MVRVQNTTNQKLLLFLAASLLIHISFSFVYLADVDLNEIFEKAKEEQVVVVKLVNPKKARQIVQTTQTNNRKPKENSFLSNKDNAFDRQTKSKNIGKFAEAVKGHRDATERKDQQKDKVEKRKKVKKISFSDLAVKTNEKIAIKKKEKVAKTASKKLGLKNGKRNGRALGASNDYLEDIPLGDFTKLNTQEYEFYGFYHRIREKLEQFWGNNIQDEAQKIYKQGRSIASESNLITGLTIRINKNGEIVDIILKSTSGVKELDDAAIKSFNQAGPFPNPPKGMIKADGKATIEWGFVVNT